MSVKHSVFIIILHHSHSFVNKCGVKTQMKKETK